MSAFNIGHKNKVHFVFKQRNSRSWAGTEDILAEEGQFLCGHGQFHSWLCKCFHLFNFPGRTLMAESEEELKSLLMKVREECQEAGLNFNIQKTKIMASDPITSWEIDGETVEIVSGSILGGSKITEDGDCSHKIKRRLFLGRKVMTKLDTILKSRDITLPTIVQLVKAKVFPVVMYGCESWTIKKIEH